MKYSDKVNVRNLICDAVFSTEGDNIITVKNNNFNHFQGQVYYMEMSQFSFTAIKKDEENVYVHVDIVPDNDFFELEKQWSTDPYVKN